MFTNCHHQPILKIYGDKALHIWKRKSSGMGFNVDNTNIFMLQFVDGQVMIAQGEEDLDYMFRKLQEEYSKWGLTIKIAKTKHMSLGTDINQCRYMVRITTKIVSHLESQMCTTTL